MREAERAGPEEDWHRLCHPRYHFAELFFLPPQMLLFYHYFLSGNKLILSPTIAVVNEPIPEVEPNETYGY